MRCYQRYQQKNKFNLQNKQINKTWRKKLEDQNILLHSNIDVSTFLTTFKKAPQKQFLKNLKSPLQNINQLLRAQVIDKRTIFIHDRKTGKIRKSKTKHTFTTSFEKRKSLKKHKLKTENYDSKIEYKKNPSTSFKFEKDELSIKKEETKKKVIKKQTIKQNFEEDKQKDQQLKKIEINLQNLNKEKNSDPKIEEKFEEQIFESQQSELDDLFSENGEQVKKKYEKQIKKQPPQTKLDILLDQKIKNALEQSLIKPKQEQLIKKEEEIIEELNSDDDVTDYEEDLDTGNNILLAYYDKFSRKKDKRRILMKHCILRIEEMDIIFPVAKGDFLWIGAIKDSEISDLEQIINQFQLPENLLKEDLSVLINGLQFFLNFVIILCSFVS